MLRAVFFFAAIALSSSVCFAIDDEEPKTRFGTIEVNESKELIFNGKQVSPDLVGNSALRILAVHAVGQTDLVLVEDEGGSACPFQFNVVTLSKHQAVVSPTFGTCSEPRTVKLLPQGLLISMVGFMGPAAQPRDRERAGRKKFVYEFKRGVLTENGKLLK